jgi:mannitol/fructose-specific phosphotransferase system IIA component
VTVGPSVADVTELLDRQAIVTDCTEQDRMSAVRRAGEILARLGAVRDGYADAMVEREDIFSSYIGEGVAMPHGTDASRELVTRTALCFLRFPDGIDWDGQQVSIAIGIAARGDEHMAVLGALARVLSDPQRAAALRAADDPEKILALLGGEEDTA